jgi:hypothetical protein
MRAGSRRSAHAAIRTNICSFLGDPGLAPNRSYPQDTHRIKEKFENQSNFGKRSFSIPWIGYSSHRPILVRIEFASFRRCLTPVADAQDGFRSPAGVAAPLLGLFF